MREDLARRRSPAEKQFGYDVRRGVGGYAPIVGTIGGFVVTGVVLVFGIASDHKLDQHGEYASMLGRATALLVLGLIGCLLSAFALAAIAAEKRLTPNLAPATLYAGVCTAIGVVSIIAAFEVLATAYLEQTRDLFVLITWGMAIGASVLVSLILGDAWTAEDLPRRHWLSTPKKGARWALMAAGAGTGVLVGAMLLYLAGVRIDGDGWVHWIVGGGIVLVLVSGLGSMFRAIHADDGKGREIRPFEALGALGAMNVYLAIFLFMLP